MTVRFDTVTPGSALKDAPLPASPKEVNQFGEPANPSAAALAERFPMVVERQLVIWGETVVYIPPGTAVEYRDFDRPIEVVWHLRSLPYRRFLRVKTQLSKTEPLEVPSVWSIWKSADWLERECYDMFGIKFKGHPDLRRILMWEQYREGFPLRKDFPLRGRFSRAEQLRQALAQNPEARYSMEELTVADAFEDLPEDMRLRLTSGERTGE